MDQGVGPRSVLEATQAEVHTGLFALRDFCSRLSEPGKLQAEPEAEVGKKNQKPKNNAENIFRKSQAGCREGER